MAYTIVPANGTSAAIVSLDATPPVRKTAGQGGLSVSYTVDGYAIAPINMPTTNFLPLVRIPSNAIIKSVELALDVAPSTSLTGSLGLLMSAGFDGTSPPNLSVYALTGAVPQFVSQSCFLYATAITAYVGNYTNVTFSNAGGNSVTDGFYVPSASQQPIWQALTVGGNGGLGKATVDGANTGSSPGRAFVTCATEPGGFFDIVWFETTTGVNTSAVALNCKVTYVQAAL